MLLFHLICYSIDFYDLRFFRLKSPVNSPLVSALELLFLAGVTFSTV